jgi:pteridine reductase
MNPIQPEPFDPLSFHLNNTIPTDRVALVTGGASRMGAVVVQALASKGYSIAIHANNSLPEARTLAARLESVGVKSLAVTASMRDEGPVRAMVHRVEDHFGRIDAVVNCARIRIPCAIESVTADDLRQHFDVNTVGTFLVAQEAGAVMVRQETGGSIVTFGDSADEHPAQNHVAYFSSKGAIPAMTRALAVEFAARNPRVRVNCILPGGFMPSDDLSKESQEELISKTPANQEDRRECVAHAVLFFLENTFITGACLPVDGGQSIFGENRRAEGR